ncbi:MAG: membrane protein insertase YidC [Pseudomonadota bacterium]
MKDDNRNFVIFAVLAAFILFAWQPIMGWFFPQPPAPVTIQDGKIKAAPKPNADPTADSPAATRDRKIVLAESPRVAIDTPKLKGSINLKGARIDDLVLLDYRETVEKGSDPIRLLSPVGAPDANFAGFGWQDNGLKPPSADTVWQASGTVLSVGKPVTLQAANGQGQTFRIELSVDDKYMFTVKQTVVNRGSGAVPVAANALVNRTGIPTEPDSWTIHVGPMAVYNGTADYDIDYKTVDEAPKAFNTTGGWLGFTEKYWLTAVVPDQGAAVSAQFRSGANKSYQADYSYSPTLLAPNQAITQTSHFFAGAKETRLLDTYEESLGIVEFDKAIDWGWFGLIEKPIFYYLDWLFRMIGNFGVAIILLTITIRGLLYPVAHKQFQSMARMRVLQPKLKALQEKYKEDKPRLQQEMMQLYKTEKVNPVAGCLPLLLQIPIMFALYKVLLLTIEMRHQPFVLWIRDLSAPDPLTPMDLFGFAPWAGHLPHFLAIGVVPILLGVSMYYQMKLNPAPMDEVQKQVFALMPWVLMFMMASFAVGLQIYWITSNMITIAQQWWLYRQHPHLKHKPAT